MSTKSPARAGFDIVIRRPSLVVAEVLWRWCFGLAAIGLLTLTFLLFLRSIPVSDADRAFMKSGNAYLMADALTHILNASKGPLLRACAVLVPGLTVLWTIAAAIGRLVTLPPLVGVSADPLPVGLSDVASLGGTAAAARTAPATEPGRGPLWSLLGISFLRAALVLAAIGGYFASAFLAADVSGIGQNQDLGVFFAMFLPLLFLVVVAWALLNWLLSVAPLFAVRDRRSTLASFADTVRLLARHRHDFIAVGTVYGLPRLIAIFGATAVSLILFGMLPALGKYAFAAALIAITLVYFIFADLLHLARMAAYAIIIDREALAASAPRDSA